MCPSWPGEAMKPCFARTFHLWFVMAGRATKLCFAPTSRPSTSCLAGPRTWMPGTRPGMTSGEVGRSSITAASAARGLFAVGEMHGAVAAGRMRGQLRFGAVVGGRCGGRRCRRHRPFDTAFLRGLILRRDVVQDRRQPAFGLVHAPAFSRGVVLDLVALDLADTEIETLGMTEIEPRHRRARPHRE